MDSNMIWVLNRFNGKTVYNIDGVPTIIDGIRGNIIRGSILNSDFTLTPTYVARVGDFFAHGSSVKKAVADATGKAMTAKPIEERIAEFVSRYPTKDSVGTGQDFYDWHNILTGSCRQGRDNFCENHGVKMDKSYTVGYFINLVRNDYGRDNIKLLAEKYNM